MPTRSPSRQHPPVNVIVNDVSATAKGVVDDTLLFVAHRRSAPEPDDLAQSLGLPSPPGNTPPGGTPPAAASPFPDEKLDEAQQWISTLEQTQAGRLLCEHMSHVNAALRATMVHVECPIDQTTTFRRVLMRGLRGPSMPFGLPVKLPKFIAMVNICGKRMLLTSEIDVLFKMLAHTPHGESGNRALFVALGALFGAREELPECSLLMTYSLPFQVELQSLYWEIRTLRKLPDGSYVDGELSYGLMDSKPHKVASTTSRETDTAVDELDAQVATFARHVAAQDLDVDPSDVTESSAAGLFDEKVCKLERIVTMLKRDRKKMLAEHEEEMGAAKRRADELLDVTTEAQQAAYTQERSDEARLKRKVEKLESETAANVSTIARLSTEVATLKADASATDLLWKGDKKKLEATRKEQDGAAGALAKQLRAANEARDKALAKQAQAHQSTVDEMERKLGKATMARRAAEADGEQMLARMQSLSNAMEGTDGVQEALNMELTWLKRANRTLTALCRLGGYRYTEALGSHRVMELALDATRGELAVTHESVERVEKERDGLGRANSQLEAQVLELETRAANAAAAADVDVAAEVADAAVADADATSPEAPPATCEAGTMTVPITSKAELELGELQTAYAKLQDELETKKKEVNGKDGELGQTRHELKQLRKKKEGAGAPHDGAVVGMPAHQQGSGPYILNQVHVNGGSGPADRGSETSGDHALEHTINQLWSSMNLVADAARDAARHKAAAHEGWSRYNALQGYTYPMQMQPAMFQGAPHGGGPHGPHGPSWGGQ